ncbi:MAG: hypothetical protein ACI89X_000727 [Planctomycetota bacterium]
MKRSLKLLACIAVTFAVAGCVTTPDREQKGLLVGAQRVLALDFGGSAVAPRVRRLTQLPTAFAGELRRAQTSLGLGDDRPLRLAATSELRRTQRIHTSGLQFLGSEVRRRPKPFEGAWPSSYELAEDTANGIDNIGRMLGPSQRPLNEIDDYTHRTDHTDHRPVRTLWQRLRRRLPF